MSTLIHQRSAGAPIVRRFTWLELDRLYVDDADGSRIGWVDLDTGVLAIESQTRTAAFHRAVDEWAAAARTPVALHTARRPRRSGRAAGTAHRAA